MQAPDVASKSFESADRTANRPDVEPAAAAATADAGVEVGVGETLITGKVRLDMDKAATERAWARNHPRCPLCGEAARPYVLGPLVLQSCR